ncbi:MAG: acylphosphatase [Xanthomonadales bacterium]|nr:acylphosphatase [Xanthomonadales bacterium]
MHDTPRQCRRFLVWGKVQGVWFRESTRREAERLGLAGSATNLADGSVEVVAAGTQADLLALANWLRCGPPTARVDQVTEEMIEDPGIKGFSTF